MPGEGGRLKRALPLVVGLIALVVVGALGLLALLKHQLETARHTENVVVAVSVPGFGVSQAEREVTEPLEHALVRLRGLESIRSTTTSDTVIVSLRVTTVGVDAPTPAYLVQQALAPSLLSLPASVSFPTVQRRELDPPTRRFLARSDSLSRLELARWLDETFRREVEMQPGVRDVELCGALLPELKVTLDQARLRALGLKADDVVNTIDLRALQLPGGLNVRTAGGSIESLRTLELNAAHAQLRDVATLELHGAPTPCTLAGPAVLVSVPMFLADAGELKLPQHPAVKLTPFSPARTATFLSSGSDEAMRALARAHPDAVVMSDEGRLSLMLPEGTEVKDVPGLDLLSMDDVHCVARVSGPELELLTEIAGKLRTALTKEHPKWLGSPWPNRVPEQVMTPVPGVEGVRRAAQLALVGIEAGTLADGTRVRVRAGSSLDDVVLPDGRLLRDAVQLTATLAPVALLRVNGQRTVELEVGLEPAEVMRAVRELQLPAGISISVE